MKRPRLFTAREAAALIGVSHATFNDWVRRHAVPFVLVGNSRRFTKDTIDAVRADRAKRGL